MPIPTRPPIPVVPIDEAARQTAFRFAQQQPTRAKATQVYRNTLAVLAANHCLDMLEISTDVAASDCWNPFSRMAADIADLQIADLGSLECRPISLNEPVCYVPAEALENRIGYLVVRLDPPYEEATIVGFSANATNSLSLTQLQPLEELLIHLEFLKAQQPGVQPIAHLSQWLNDQVIAIDQHWQTIEAALGTLHQPALALRSQNSALARSEVQRMVEQLYASQTSQASQLPVDPDPKAALAHLIQTTSDEEIRWKAAEMLWTIDPGHPATGVRRVTDLGMVLAEQSIALMVAVLQREAHFSILARVYPLTEPCLPAGLKLAVLGQDGHVGLEIQARERDNYIQLKLRGKLGEQFSIQIRLNHDVITEQFMI